MSYLNVTVNDSTVNILSAMFLMGLVILVINAGLLFSSLFLVFKSVKGLFARGISWPRKLMGSSLRLIASLVVFAIFVIFFIATNTAGSWDFEIQPIDDPYDRYEVRFVGTTYHFGSVAGYNDYFRLTAEEGDLLSEKLGEDILDLTGGVSYGFCGGGTSSANPPDDPVLKALVELWPEEFPDELAEYYQQNDK